MMDLNEVLNCIIRAEKEAEMEIKMTRIEADFGEHRVFRDPLTIRLTHISDEISRIVPEINRNALELLMYHYYNHHPLENEPQFSNLTAQDIDRLKTIANVVACYRLDKNLI